MYETEDKLREQIADQQEQIEFLRATCGALLRNLQKAQPWTENHTEVAIIHLETAMTLTEPKE